MLRSLGYSDKNSERKMLFARCRQINSYLKGRIFENSLNTGDWLFRDGQDKIDNINEGEWTAFTAKDRWGYPEQYCWFKQTVVIPEAFSGKRVIYEISPYFDRRWDSSAQQFIAFVNGRITQGIDSNHTFFVLSEEAKAGEQFDIALSAYCDDWKYCGTNELKAEIKTLNQDVSDLCYDIDNLLNTAEQFDTDNTDRVDIIKAVNEACNLLELSTPSDEIFHFSIKEASDYLHKNIFGSKSAVTVSAVGHTHIDTAWLWRLRQTRDKAGRSFATVINLMKEFPEYKFMSPQAQLYDFVKQDYPELYDEMKKAAKEGRWEAEGSMWVESDTNVISGESLVRQFLFGKRFFRDEFGADNKVMWLPDVFGYSGAIPQVMKLSDIDYFMTTKISWNEYTRFPYDTFTWEGIDGTQVLAHFEPSTDKDDADRFYTTYNANINPKTAIWSWHRYSNKDLNKNILCSYGHGDGGGGPTREMLENIRRMNEGIPGCPDVKQDSVREFFERLDRETKGNRHLPKWKGELYLEYHRGTLTAQARNKKYNRKSELAYHDIETLSETAHLLGGYEYPQKDINEAWKIILLNQFHDIIPGSSISPVYEDSKEQYEKILADGRKLKDGAIKAIADKIVLASTGIVVFNTFGQSRTDVAFADSPYEGDISVYDGDEEIPSQRTYDGRLAFLAKNVPSKGYKVFSVRASKGKNFAPVKADTEGAENEYYRLKFNENKNIASIYHKASGRTVSDSTDSGKLTAYEDRSHQYEAWDIKCYYDEKSWDIDNVKSCNVIENGAVRTVVEIEREFNTSLIKQYYIFYNHSCRIDVGYDIDWKEKNIALKADYPVDVNTDRATFDIQFGNLQRSSTNNTLADFAQFESCGHKWVDLSDNGFGLSILNDCKYGWNVKDGHIRPTLLRSATTPNHNQDRERHQFTYAIYPHTGAVADSDVVREAYSLNLPLETCVEAPHSGKLPAEFSLVSCDAGNIVIETVKKAEDSDALIVRMYETWNRRTQTELTFAEDISSASVCNLLEEKDVQVDFEGKKLALQFRPFEIKTLKIKFAED